LTSIPTNAEDEYLADSYSDLYLTGELNGSTLATLIPTTKRYKRLILKSSIFSTPIGNNILGDKGGPYVLGQEIAYIDFMIYDLLKDDCEFKNDGEKYPHIAKFEKAFEARPSLHSYFAKIQLKNKINILTLI
jgi:hypothetical protein